MTLFSLVNLISIPLAIIKKSAGFRGKRGEVIHLDAEKKGTYSSCSQNKQILANERECWNDDAMEIKRKYFECCWECSRALCHNASDIILLLIKKRNFCIYLCIYKKTKFVCDHLVCNDVSRNDCQ